MTYQEMSRDGGGKIVREMKKIVCISIGPDWQNNHITIGKLYESNPWFNNGNVLITNDLGNKVEYHPDLFIDLSEVRNNKLKELGI